MPDSVAGRANSCRVELWAVAMSARSAWVRARSSGASRIGHDCGKGKAPRGGCLVCKSPVGQPSGFYIFCHLQTLRAHPARSKAYAMELVSSF